MCVACVGRGGNRGWCVVNGGSCMCDEMFGCGIQSGYCLEECVVITKRCAVKGGDKEWFVDTIIRSGE